MNKKNVTLSILLGILILISVLLGVTNNTRRSTISDSDLFAVNDTSLINKIIIEGKDIQNSLVRHNGMWTINQRHPADPYIIQVFLIVCNQVEISRGVAKVQREEIIKSLKNEGYLVTLYHDNDVIKTYYAGGNANKTISYMMEANARTPFIVNLPGRDTYLSGIYEISENDWRDRMVFSSSWRTLQELKMSYPGHPEYDFTITSDMNFPEVTGIQQPDTARLIDFLDRFMYFQTDKYLSGSESKKYDSLSNTSPEALLTIKDAMDSRSGIIEFFPVLKGDNVMLGRKDSTQLMLFEFRRIKDIFIKKEDFISDKE